MVREGASVQFEVISAELSAEASKQIRDSLTYRRSNVGKQGYLGERPITKPDASDYVFRRQRPPSPGIVRPTAVIAEDEEHVFFECLRINATSDTRNGKIFVPRLSVNPYPSTAYIDFVTWDTDYPLDQKVRVRAVRRSEHNHIISAGCMEQVKPATIVIFDRLEDIPEYTVICTRINKLIHEKILAVRNCRIHTPTVHSERLCGDLEQDEYKHRSDGRLGYFAN